MTDLETSVAKYGLVKSSQWLNGFIDTLKEKSPHRTDLIDEFGQLSKDLMVAYLIMSEIDGENQSLRQQVADQGPEMLRLQAEIDRLTKMNQELLRGI